MGGPSRETSSSVHLKNSDGLMENPTGDSGLAGAVVTSAFSKLPESNNLPINGNPGPDSPVCPGSPEDIFCDFLYWRTPLPDISQDLELLLSGTGPQEAGCCLPETVRSSCVARSEIQKVLDSLQEHMMNDPDVQGQCYPPAKGTSGVLGPAFCGTCVCPYLW